ncbi:MAG: response regulator [Lachnospiraceae bacterium]|nr:response regulator [Lachnospiraceae bacterium]
MNRWKKRILIILIASVLNVLGRYPAFYFELPAYLNLCGTILAAYVEGPIAGAAAAVLGCLFSSFFSPGDWYYLIADVAVAIAAGLIAPKNRYFERFIMIISATTFFAVVKALFLIPVNLHLRGGRIGLYIADAIIDYLASVSVPAWLQYAAAALYISFADALVAMLLIFSGMYIFKRFGKKKRAAELRKQLGGKVYLGLVAAFFLTASFGSQRAYAEESVSFIEKLYNSENGLVGGCLNDIAMTRDGSMWIATYGGLFRFNGSKFVLIDNLKSVRSVQCLFVDEEDRLWAGTQDAGITLLNIDMTWCTLDTSSGLPSNSVKCISRDSSGLYYIGTTAGLAVAEYDNGEIRIVKTDTEVGNIRDLSPDHEGHMIVMNNLGDIRCFENGESILSLYMGSAIPRGISHADNGDLYIGTDEGTIAIYAFSPDGFRVKGHIIAEGMKTIKDLYFDDNGIIYVASDNGIGYIDSSGRLTMIESGEFNNSIDHIFKDYQGNIWFTSSRCGLLCLGKSSFTDVFRLCEENNIVCNTIRQWNGHLYVGTNSGLKILDVDAGKSIKDDVTAEFEDIRIRCMETDSAGNLLVATYDKGLMEITPAGKVSAYVPTQETGRSIRVVSILSDGTVIASGDGGMTFLKDKKVLHRLQTGKELAGGTVLNILETDDHTLLCGTDGDGIAVIRDGKLQKYLSREDSLSSGVVLRIVKDSRSDGYFVLTGSGLCYMNRDFVISELAMPYYNNFDIAMNSSGEIFVLGGAGIYISEYDALMNRGAMESYTLLDAKAGLPGSITSNAWNLVTDDEQIYICGTTGIYLLDLNNYEMQISDFRTKITAVIIDGVYEDVTQIGTIEIPKGTDRIELNLEINNYTSADPYVSYYLSGVDEEKTTVLASKLSSVIYHDIPYGNHDFIISVLDENGRELSGQTYVFTKEKELYETMGFILYFYIFLLLFIVFIVISIVQGALMSQQKKEKGRHELVVKQLEREKAEALERALHMEEDANRTKSAFLANMSHEIRTPINAIIGMDTMILRESGEEQIRSYALDIHNAGKTLLTLINELLNYSKSEDDHEKAVETDAALSEKEHFHAPDARLLIVDDVETNLIVAKNLLRRTRVQIDAVQSGRDAVEHASGTPYDIILMESMLPGMNGEETMLEIRKKCPLNAETPVIVLTAHAVDGAREEYLRLGYTNYLAKPLDGSKLEAMIQSYLPDEKILPADEEQEDTDGHPAAARTDEAAGTDSMISRLSRIDGIDTAGGVEIAGGEDAYLLFCRNFRDTAKTQIGMIREAFEKENYEDYTIQVQALKNAARLIGATELSEKARELEEAGRESGIDRIRQDTPAVLEKYEWFYDRLDEIF